MSNCKVLLFSLLAEALGQREVLATVELPCAASVVVDTLASEYPPVLQLRHVIRVAVNREYVAETYIINPGDEVAIITPTSGG